MHARVWWRRWPVSLYRGMRWAGVGIGIVYLGTVDQIELHPHWALWIFLSLIILTLRATA